MVRVERSYPAPASLAVEKEKAYGTCRTDEIIQRLVADFHNKCYICEMKNLQDPIIEHRLPHHNGKNRERMFAWDNLFLACGHCNMAKNKQKYDEGIIDCCKEDPELLLTISLKDGKVRAEIKTDAVDTTVKNTVLLLNEIFNKGSSGMRNVRCQERYRELNLEMNTFFRLLRKYEEHGNFEDSDLELREILDRKSAFAQFKRDYIRTHKDFYPELVNCLE